MSVADPYAPRSILLAADLGARGDRALARALEISRRHDAQLLIVHAVEAIAAASDTGDHPSWLRPADIVARVKARLSRGLSQEDRDAIDGATVLVEAGKPAEVVEQIATSERAELVITGLARESLFTHESVVLGEAVEHWLRRLPIPVLIVRNRVSGPYRQIVVGTDFSQSSARALQMAVRFFPGELLDLLHATEARAAASVTDAAGAAEPDKVGAEFTQFMNSIFLPEDARARIVQAIEAGPPVEVICRHVEATAAELVVLGTEGRGGLREALFGSTAKAIVSALPCDALVVRGPKQ